MSLAKNTSAELSAEVFFSAGKGRLPFLAGHSRVSGTVHHPRLGRDAIEKQQFFHCYKPIPLRLKGVHHLKGRLHGGGIDIVQKNDGDRKSVV